jgi:colanic acid biosynthesis glycosyl transferase WcaI
MARPGTELESVVSRCGLIVPPDDPSALASAVEALADNPSRRRALGMRASAFAQEHFEINAVLSRVFETQESREDQDIEADRCSSAIAARSR